MEHHRAGPTAADIPDRTIHEIINRAPRGFVSLDELEGLLPSFPPAVVLEKLRQMVNEKHLDALCTCGCRGPYFRYIDEVKT